MIFTEYYHSLDRDYGHIAPADVPPEPGMPLETSSLGPGEIGTGTNPMAHQVSGFNEKIRAGAGKIEIEFIGQGKTNSQQPGPESFGRKDREDIRGLAEINEIKTSVHASWHNGGLAGLGKEGFNEQIRQNAITEIEKAIHFAAEATKGGAIVFHTGEWQRPMTDLKGGRFEAFPGEKEKSPIMVVDGQTGDISAVRRDQFVFEPKFYTAKEYEPVIKKKLVGTIDKKGNTIEADDWIDMQGNAIKREWVISDRREEIERLFDRVPVWNAAKTNFDIEQRDFNYFENEAKKLSEKNGKTITPEELFFKSQLADHVSQAKGQSLFSARDYEQIKEARDAAQKALEYYSKFEGILSEDEKWQIMVQKGIVQQGLAPPRNMLPSEFLKEQIKQFDDQMRYVHEASASSDARAREALDRMKRVTTLDKFGTDKTADTIARLGMTAMRYTDAHQKELNEPLYVAPENWDPGAFGSHPDELRKIVEGSRKKMQQKLMGEGMSEEEAKSKAKTHIKATLDVGHFNLWRQHFQKNEGESPAARDKRFNNWLLAETKKLAKDGIIGHIHLTDNFGYDDEHLTPGQGNVPMKEFIKAMEEAGLKDFIAEAGSFNAASIMPDTWAMMGSPIYGTTRAPTFRSLHEQHFGYHNPSTYIVGAYAPSNEWRLWSEVPLE
jgi:hypothetical protein